MSSRRMAVLCLLFVLPTATLVAAENDPSVPESVTFAEHVAPIFFANCVSCHRPNDEAPMSLLTYEAARPWAKSIRGAVTERDMPPWDADPRHGDFENDVSLSEHDIALVRRWVDLGAPLGDIALLPAQPALPRLAVGRWVESPTA